MVAKESKDRASLERTKVVVRHLPAGLTQDGFVKTISKFVDPDRYNWLAYYPGKVSIKSTVLSRAYLNFVDPHSVYEFKAKFDGHLFVSNKGNQYRCSVEYAPFQKVPLPSKRNPLENTIHQDPDYQQFAQQLQDGPALLPSAAAQRESQERAAAMAGTPPDGPPTNALLEYLKAKYQSNPAMKLGGVRRRARPEQDDQVGKPGTVIAGPNSRPTSKGASSKAQTAATTAATAATAAVKGSSRGGRDPAGDSKAGPPASSSSSSSKEPAGPATITSTVQARTPSTPSTHAPKVIMSRAGHLSSASTGPNATATAIAAAAATAAATGRPSSAAPSVLARGAAPSQPAPTTAPAPARPPPSSGPAGGSQRGPGAARAPTSSLSAARDSSKGPATAAAATTLTTASSSASPATPAPLQRSLASARAPVTLAARSTGNGVNAASSVLARAGSGSDATQPTTANGAGAAAAAASAALVGGSAEGEGAPGPKRKVRMGFQAYKPPIRNHDPEGGDSHPTTSSRPTKLTSSSSNLLFSKTLRSMVFGLQNGGELAARIFFFIELALNLVSMCLMLTNPAKFLLQFVPEKTKTNKPEFFGEGASAFVYWYAVLLAVLTYVEARALISNNVPALLVVMESLLLGDFLYIGAAWALARAAGGWTSGNIAGVVISKILAGWRIYWLVIVYMDGAQGKGNSWSR